MIPAQKMEFIDQLKQTVSVSYPPQRIVSLVPSQTELLADLGLEQEVVGLTKFCIHPASWRKEKTIVGGTKSFHHDRIKALHPDLIIANKEENTKEDILRLQEHYPVWVSDVQSLEEALQMIDGLGKVTGKKEQAQLLARQLAESFTTLPEFSVLKAAYLIWRKPYMVAGSDTFIHEMMKYAGFENVFANQQRYPAVNLEDIAALAPDVLLLSSEPYPFKEKHLEEFREACPHAVVQLVDGELFSWYGSRLQYAPAYFKALRSGL
jgi:ABC-type Fe3+-hydroxamate transport system substrate-binding protein